MFMPSRNIIKSYDIDTYYHIYNRGVEKRKIFLDDQDYAVFIGLLRRYLDKKPDLDPRGREREWLDGEVEIIAFCLMPNHFHLLLYQTENDSITKLMRAVCSSYSTYFNQKYDRVGSLFQGCFKAVAINNHEYLQYMSRYIHRNPSNYLNWQWSSLDYWTGKKTAYWIKHQRLNDMDPENYINFINDNDDYEASLEDIYNITL